MKRFLLILFFIAAIFCDKKTFAQIDSTPILKSYQVGIFAPLYLDSLFSTSGNFRYKQGIPKFVMPGVDFVQGAQIAFDSMHVWNADIHAYVYDSKSYKTPITTLIANRSLDNLDLIIGSVKDNDYKQLADFAGKKNIPFISATYPNDGGVTANPFVMIANSTLKAHCEAIFSYALQNHGTDKILLCRQSGTQEDKVSAYFKTFNEQDGKKLLNIEILNFDSSISASFLRSRLDSNKQSIIIGGSLDEDFASNLATACYNIDKEFPITYPITLIGMPNWDGFKSFTTKDAYENFPIYFTTPYFNNKWDSHSKMIAAVYNKKYKGSPSDMTFKGFESVWLFTKLLAKYPNDFMSHINDKTFKVFTEYNFHPVKLKKENAIPDYFENKHLYFVKILNGTLSKAW
ncbi:MAG: ABC transporter substrate-binding protein [Bacteroidota bacterium]